MELEQQPKPWERRLEAAVQVHELVVAGDRMLGRVSPRSEDTRQSVVFAIDAALASGVPEATLGAWLTARARAAA